METWIILKLLKTRKFFVGLVKYADKKLKNCVALMYLLYMSGY